MSEKSSTNKPLRVENIRKVELHRHLELSIRHSTIRELAPLFGIEIPNDKVFAERFLIDQPMNDLGSVLNKFLDTQLLLSSEETLERIAYEACVDAFKEGVLILELRYAPTFIRYRHDHLSFDKIHLAIVRGVERAEKDFPIAVGLTCIIQRILPVKEAEKVTEFAIEHRNTFISLDLADNEEGFDSKPFSPFFMKAKKAGLGITVHAGEINTPKAPTYVKDAVEFLGATRIGHGVQVYRDPAMIEYVKKHNLTLELCPTSNYLTQAIPGTIEDHPFRQLYYAGIRTTINTDDPGIFNTDMNKEYLILRDKFNFRAAEFEKCNDYAASASFISLEKKQSVWPREILQI
ncbi:MAG: adenosine deaminase [Bdellovibrionales bacterium]|nr:adenosine deaminase [Bdellovibrionales bacterium]